MTVASISVRVMSLRVRRPGLPERLADAGTALSQLDRLQAANRRVDPQPTAAQKDSGNYRKGHFTWKGLDIAIETAKGQKRKPEWPPLKNSYGYFKKTESGADEDPIDVFISEKNLDSEVVFVINQLKKDGKTFDEHKVIIGDSSEADARKTYLANYEPGWQGLGSVRAMTLEDFKKWLEDGDTAKAAAEEDRLWVYACPECHGDAYNGDPEIGARYRGGAKCGACGHRFSVVGIAPERKNGPILLDKDAEDEGDHVECDCEVKEADFAPGLPRRSNFGDLTQLKANQLYDLV